MIGIRPSNGSETFSEQSCDEIYEILSDCRLYVRSTGPQSVTDDIVKSNSYDAVFIDERNEQNMNQLIVEKKLADFDSATKHFIDLDVDYDSLPRPVRSPVEENWDSDDCNENIYEASYLNRSEGESNIPFLNSNGEGSDNDWDMQFTQEEAMDFVRS